jgi:SPP1 gp7 family putative phage head morphogenesis protein
MAKGSRIKDAAGNVGTATDLSSSLVQRVAQGVRYAVSGVKPDTWMGPAQPLQPVAQEAEGRVLDYQIGYNLQTRTRQETEDVIGFHELRSLAELCNLVRLAVETRKDQISRLAWNIKVRETGKPLKSKEIPANDPRSAELEAFFRLPDKEHDWATWLRMVTEDLLVIDAPALIRRRDKGGRPYAFNVMDGALIKRVIDGSGLTPLPPSPAYQQMLHGLPAVDYTTEQLLYMPRNPRPHRLYGFSPVEQIVMTVNIALRRSMTQLNYFTEGNIPEALISCPPEWRPAQIREMQEIFDDMLRGDLAARSGAKFVPGGLNVQFTKDALLKDDFDEWLARIVCFAFSIAPTPFIKAARSGEAQKSSHDSALEEGLAPLQMWVKNMMDRLLAEDFQSPDLEFVWFDDTAADPLVLMQVNTGYVTAGLKSRNEVRSELGLDPMPDGDEYTVTTGTGVVRLSDALAPPEPLPQFVAPGAGSGGSPPSPANDQSAEAPPGQRKKKDLTKADDSDEQPEDDGHEDRLAVLLLAALRKQGDVLAAKIASTEHTTASASRELEQAIDSGALDMDALHAPVSAILEKNTVEAAHEALVELPASPVEPEGSAQAQSAVVDHGASPVVEPGAPFAAASAQPELTAGIPSTNITSLLNEDAVEFANQRSAEMIGKKFIDGKLVDNPDAKWAITDTTRDGIRQLVAKAEEQGQSVQQLAKAIRESALFSKSRAETIARTELSFADNNGAIMAWKRSGIVSKKRWLLGSEHMICDSCDANAKAGAIDLDDVFPSGDYCSPQHPGCVCTCVPVIK